MELPVGVYSIFRKDAAEVNEGSFSRSGKLLTSIGLPQRVNEPSFTSLETYKKVKEPFLNLQFLVESAHQSLTFTAEHLNSQGDDFHVICDVILMHPCISVQKALRGSLLLTKNVSYFAKTSIDFPKSAVILQKHTSRFSDK